MESLGKMFSVVLLMGGVIVTNLYSGDGLPIGGQEAINRFSSFFLERTFGQMTMNDCN